MKVRSNPPVEAYLMMTPMIDVVFQLLIFFLVGARFRVPEGELEAYLPDKGAPVRLTTRVDDVEEIRVTLRVSQAGANNPDAPPSVLLDGKTVGASAKATGSVRWLEQELSKLATDPGIREKVPVIIEAEAELAYKWVIDTLNLCRRLKFKEVNFAASKRGAPLPSGPAPPPG